MYLLNCYKCGKQVERTNNQPSAICFTRRRDKNRETALEYKHKKYEVLRHEKERAISLRKAIAYRRLHQRLKGRPSLVCGN